MKVAPDWWPHKPRDYGTGQNKAGAKWKYGQSTMSTQNENNNKEKVWGEGRAFFFSFSFRDQLSVNMPH